MTRIVVALAITALGAGCSGSVIAGDIPCLGTVCGQNAYCDMQLGACACNSGHQGDPATGCTSSLSSPQCTDGYIATDGACIHSKQVNCHDAAPDNATSSIVEVTVTYTTTGGWSAPADCSWTCNSGYQQSGSCCIAEPVSPSPTWSTEFVRNNAALWQQLTLSSGTRVDFGVADPAADDNAVAVLTFPGNPNLKSTDRVGPGFGAEIDTLRSFKYGTFRARLQPATCQPSEEVVSGFFVYFNDGKDDNGNGLIDNSEIDIELLCGEPQFISLTSWTDYEESPERFVKWTRVIDTAKGAYAESPADNVYGYGAWVSAPELKIPGFPAPNTFYEMGFEWHATSLRFFIVVDGREITLWNGPAAQYIPQRATPLIFDLWHPREHWFDRGGQPANYPASDAQLRIDWVSYWAE